MTGPTFFAAPEDFRRWLAANHASAGELLVGFWKVGSGRPSMTWPQSVGEALCFGWIDGVRRSLGEDAYTIRFTPRRPGSVWSAKNLARFAELEAEGRITPAGRAAFDDPKAKTGRYSFERPPAGWRRTSWPPSRPRRRPGPASTPSRPPTARPPCTG